VNRCESDRQQKDRFRATRHDLISLFLRSVSNQLLFAVIELKGRLEIPRLRAAVMSMSAELPLLGRRLEDSRNWPVWRVCGRGHGPNIVTFDQAGPAAPYLMISACKPDRLGSAAELWLFRHTEGDTLCLVADHALTDAAGLKQLCYWLAGAYSRHPKASPTAAGVDPGGGRNQQMIFRELGIRECVARLRAWRPAAGSWLFPPGAATDRPKLRLRVKHISASTLEGMQKLRQTSNATINDQLVAAFYVSLKSHVHHRAQQRLPIQIMADLRRYLPADVLPGIANLSSSVVIRLPSSMNGDFSKALAATSREINRRKSGRLGLDASLAAHCLFAGGHRLARAAFNRLINQSRKTGLAIPILSNFGAIDEQSLRFSGTAVRDAYLIGPSLTVPGLMLCVSGYRGKLTLSASYDESSVPDWLIRKIITTMDTTLMRASERAKPNA
jgi:NRPS condensation-like uncharacterized protein